MERTYNNNAPRSTNEKNIRWVRRGNRTRKAQKGPVVTNMRIRKNEKEDIGKK